MSRNVQWRHSVSDACCWHQSQALESTIYILRQTGPTGFLLQEEGETKNVKVFLGDPHSCTCPVFKKEKDLCKHICWLLLRKFRLSVNDSMSWQLGLVEREINEVLHGKVASDQNCVKRQRRNSTSVEALDGYNVVEQRDIAADDVCPICQEELLAKKLPVTYCKFGCGNSIHIKCMRVWAEHQQKTSEEGKIKCPMCREDFGSFDLLKTEMKNAGYVPPVAPGLRMDRHIGMGCSNCGVSPIEGKCYRCTVCAGYLMCQRCFSLPLHTNHSFQYRHKRNQKWQSATRILGSGLPPAVVNDLMHREISENDYDMLLQLERNSQEELSNLTEEAIKSLPIERVRDGGPLQALGCQCRVCLRGFVAGQCVRRLPCKHKFHKDCIDSWLLHSHPTCPIDGLLAVPNQDFLSDQQKVMLQTTASNNDQHQICDHESRTLVLTAFGIPVASSKVKGSTGETGNYRLLPSIQKPRQNLLTAAFDLELSGTAVGEGTANHNHQTNTTEEQIPGQGLLQQAIQHRERISQQVQAMQRTISTASNPDELLTSSALIQYLQSDRHSRPSSLPFGGGETLDLQRASGKVFTKTSDPTRALGQITHHSGLRRGHCSLLRHRANSLERTIPSIQTVREVVGDLFLGNNPAIQPAATENWIAPRLPLAPRPRGRRFKSVFHNQMSSVHNVKSLGNSDIRLIGSAIENMTDDMSHQTQEG